MADVTARSLQYEYKAVSVAPPAPGPPAPRRPRTGPFPVSLTQRVPLNLAPGFGGPGSPRESGLPEEGSVYRLFLGSGRGF